MRSLKNNKLSKSIITLTAAVLLLIGITTTSAIAADATAAVDIASAYVWRGQTFNDGAVAQPSIDVAAENGLGINVWGNYDISDYDGTLDDNEFSEIDLTLSYSFAISKIDASVGIISYLFPAGAGETNEIFLSLGTEITDGLSVGLDLYYDVEAFNEFSYGALSLSYGKDLSDKLSMEVGCSLGFAGDDFAQSVGDGTEDGGLYDYSVSLSFGYALTDKWSLSAGATYVDAADDDNLQDKSVGPMDVNGIFTVGVAYSF